MIQVANYNLNIYPKGSVDLKNGKIYDLLIVDRFTAKGTWLDKKRFYVTDKFGMLEKANEEFVDTLYNSYPDNAKINIRPMICIERG